MLLSWYIEVLSDTDLELLKAGILSIPRVRNVYTTLEEIKAEIEKVLEG